MRDRETQIPYFEVIVVITHRDFGLTRAEREIEKQLCHIAKLM